MCRCSICKSELRSLFTFILLRVHILFIDNCVMSMDTFVFYLLMKRPNARTSSLDCLWIICKHKKPSHQNWRKTTVTWPKQKLWIKEEISYWHWPDSARANVTDSNFQPALRTDYSSSAFRERQEWPPAMLVQLDSRSLLPGRNPSGKIFAAPGSSLAPPRPGGLVWR